MSNIFLHFPFSQCWLILRDKIATTFATPRTRNSCLPKKVRYHYFFRFSLYLFPCQSVFLLVSSLPIGYFPCILAYMSAYTLHREDVFGQEGQISLLFCWFHYLPPTSPFLHLSPSVSVLIYLFTCLDFACWLVSMYFGIGVRIYSSWGRLVWPRRSDLIIVLLMHYPTSPLTPFPLLSLNLFPCRSIFLFVLSMAIGQSSRIFAYFLQYTHHGEDIKVSSPSTSLW